MADLDAEFAAFMGEIEETEKQVAAVTQSDQQQAGGEATGEAAAAQPAPASVPPKLPPPKLPPPKVPAPKLPPPSAPPPGGAASSGGDLDAELARFHAEMAAEEQGGMLAPPRLAAPKLAPPPTRPPGGMEAPAPSTSLPPPPARPAIMRAQMAGGPPPAPPPGTVLIGPGPGMYPPPPQGGYAPAPHGLPGPPPATGPAAAASQYYGDPSAAAQYLAGPSAVPDAQALEGVKAAIQREAQDPAGGGAKKEEKKKAVPRAAGGEKWWDPTLTEWPEGDYRIFVGDLGNEVNDEVLGRAFRHYNSFAKAKIVRDNRSKKSKGFGFVSLLDHKEGADALREMNGRYIGNRPCKLSKSNWDERLNKEILNRKRKGGRGGGRGKKPHVG